MATRELPKNIEAEMNVLGIAFINPYSLEKILENLNSDMFFDRHN